VTTFDGYDGEHEEEEPSGRHARRDIEADLRELIDIIANAKQMPLSNSALVPREDVLGLLEQALHSLPDEIREARWALRDREELMAAEVQKAQQLMDQVRAEAARMVDKTEVVRQSRLKAEQIVAEAQASARQMVNEHEDYLDAKLGSYEIVMERLLKTIRSGRERLNAQSMPSTNAPAGADEFLGAAPPPPTGEYRAPDDEASFFDQDAH
jgi:cell division septum initiation protein DivIVA